MGKKKITHEEYLERLNFFTNNNFEATEKYVNSDTPISIKCKRCGEERKRFPYNFLKDPDKDKCEYCRGKKKMIDDISKRDDHELIDIIEYSFPSISKSYIKVKHKNCGKERVVQYSGFKRGRLCGFCSSSTNMKYTIEDISDLINNKYNGDFILLSEEYENNKKPLKFLHTECEKEFESTFNNLDYNGVCPSCYKRSKGEHSIRQFLDNNDINYTMERSIDNLKDIKKLRFDFYIEDLDIYIEFDGKQHFIEDPKSFMYRDHSDRLKRDQIKNEFCIENGIKLFRISFRDLDNVEEILNSIIKDKSSTTIERYNVYLIEDGKEFNKDNYYIFSRVQPSDRVGN